MDKITVETGKVKVKNEQGEEVPASCTFEYDFGENLGAAVAKFGEAVVFSLYKAKAVIQVQDLARNALVAGKSSAEAAELASKHKLGESTAIAKDPIAMGLNALDKMTPEERAAFIKQLQEKAKKLGA